jgi:quercetin dioxygenase-like cupin family protein
MNSKYFTNRNHSVRYYSVILILISILVLTACQTNAADKESILEEKVSEVLLQSSVAWDGTPYTAYPKGQPELTVLKITIPANSELDWHKHPMPNAAYVASGELTVIRGDNEKTVTLKAGEVLPEIVDVRHRGFTGDKAVELIVLYAGTEGMPTAVAEE